MRIIPTSKLYKSKDNSILFGVLGGLSNYFNIDPVLCRVVFVIAMVMFDGLVILAYIILAFVMPEEPLEHSNQSLDHTHRRQTSQRPTDIDEMEDDEWSNF